MAFGIIDTQYIDWPDNIDQAYLRGLVTRAGVDFPALAAEIDGRLADLDSNLDPLVADLISPTTDAISEDNTPAAFFVDEATEYTIPRPQSADVSAHPLSIRDWDESLGITEDGLQEMPLSRILVNVESLPLGYRALYRRRTLNRLFNDGQWRVDRRTSMRSPGFAGSGSGDNIFIDPYPTGQPTVDGYSLYFRTTSASLAATIQSLVLPELEMWNDPPFDMLSNSTMLALITAINPGDPINGFVSAGSALVRTGTGESEALVDPAKYIGVLFGKIRVRLPIKDFSDPNISIFKTDGPVSPGNPLTWRYDALRGRRAFIRTRSLFPLADAIVKQRFDINVLRRTSAALIRVAASGAYVAPVIS